MIENYLYMFINIIIDALFYASIGFIMWFSIGVIIGIIFSLNEIRLEHGLKSMFYVFFNKLKYKSTRMGIKKEIIMIIPVWPLILYCFIVLVIMRVLVSIARFFIKLIED